MRGEGAVFEGYASLFGQADAAGDVVLPGAFRNSLRERGSAGIRMLFQHDPGQPIGIWHELREDRHGLFVRGELAKSVMRARELSGLLQIGAINGLSIGFKTRTALRDRRNGLRRLLALDLWEISLVTFPMLQAARVERIMPMKEQNSNILPFKSKGLK